MNESLKELAVRYFEGPIAPEEECELFGFLAASPENAALMREWERERRTSADVLRSRSHSRIRAAFSGEAARNPKSSHSSSGAMGPSK